MTDTEKVERMRQLINASLPIFEAFGRMGGMPRDMRLALAVIANNQRLACMVAEGREEDGVPEILKTAIDNRVKEWDAETPPEDLN